MDLTSPRLDAASDVAVASNDVRGPKFVYASGATPLEGYTIKRGLGRGGFGEVYFATSDAGKEVALKLIRRNLDVEMRGVTHCLNLKHPNLISVYDLRTDTMGDQWVVMEYVAGESLEAVIERHPHGMPEAEVLRWMRGIGAGVAYLHDHGIVHRDLKPGNVFLDIDASSEGLVKIGDYGLSKFISCSRRSGQTESVGTVHYMAPEIANGRYGREIDTYALGVMLYEMLTGHVPFEGESVGEVLMKHLTAEPNLGAVKEPYREIVKRTLAKDPAVRIATVGELLSLLPQESGVYKAPPPARPAVAADGIGGDARLGDPTVRGSRTTMPPPYQPPPLREPIAAAIVGQLSRFAHAWHDLPMNRFGKGVVLLVCIYLTIVVVVGTAELWAPMAVIGAVAYVIYYVCWTLFIRPSEKRHLEALAEQRRAQQAQQVHPPSPAPVATPHVVPVASPTELVPEPGKYRSYRRRLRVDWQQKVNAQLAAKPWGTLFTELLGSMVLSGIVCAFLALLAVLMMGASELNVGLPLVLWLGSVSAVGSWAVLVTAKLSEGRVEDQIPMRMGMLACGAAVGCFAWGVSDLMMMGLPISDDIGMMPHNTLLADTFNLRNSQPAASSPYFMGAVTPGIIFSVMYFALLFVGLRWWRMAEYVRTTRLSLWSVVLVITAAWALHLVAWYPQPTGMFVAGIMAIATQVSSLWLAPSQRKSLVEETVTGYGGYN